MASGKTAKIAPSNRGKTPRFARRHPGDHWRVRDVKLGPGGVIAMSGHHDETPRTFIDLFVVDSTYPGNCHVIYSREFSRLGGEMSWRRFVAFLSDSVVVTCASDHIDSYDIYGDVELSANTFDGPACSVAVSSEGEVYVGMYRSNRVVVFDSNLAKLRTIILSGIDNGDDWAVDINVIRGGTLLVRTYRGRALVYSKSGVQQGTRLRAMGETWAHSIAVSSELLFVLWRWTFITAYDLPSILGGSGGDHPFLFSLAVDDSSLVRVGDDRLVTVDSDSGEVREYSMGDVLTYSSLKAAASAMLDADECGRLADLFSLPRDRVETITSSETPAKGLLLSLEERGVIQSSNVDRLTKALKALDIGPGLSAITDRYMETRPPETEYERFLAGLSGHLVTPLLEKMCDYFDVNTDAKGSILSSEDPGSSFLRHLERTHVINESDVGCLEAPFHQMELVQATAKVREFQSSVNEQRHTNVKDLQSMGDKRDYFIHCLRKTILVWYETSTPVPWKKSCQWKMTDLFVNIGLVIAESKSRSSYRGIDAKSKVHYGDIFINASLRSKSRIILDGPPGSGKTMLLSRLAYDWALGKFGDDMAVVFLPLRIVEDRSLVQAIRGFYKMDLLTDADIESLLCSLDLESRLLLDGYEEYNGAELMALMSNETFQNCKVVLSARSDYTRHLPSCTMLKIGEFGEDERNTYIESLFPEDPDREKATKDLVNSSPVVLDLCSVSLLFVLAVHNTVGLETLSRHKVSPFIEAMVRELSAEEVDTGVESPDARGSSVPESSKEGGHETLEELAFNGLCRGKQQLMWPKEFLDENVVDINRWVNTGILVLEESISHDRALQRGTEGADENMTVAGGSGIVSDTSTQDTLSDSANAESDQEIPTRDTDQETSQSQEETSPDEASRPHVALQVKFLHKIVQEWFAAKHLVKLFKDCQSRGDEVSFGVHLDNIDPADLHHVLRFASNKSSEVFRYIAEYLLNGSAGKDGVVAQYVVDCIFNCILEYEGDLADIRDIISALCKGKIEIGSADSRMLLRTKSRVLKYASDNSIPIRLVSIHDIIETACASRLSLGSGIEIDVLSTLGELEVSRWDHQFEEQYHEELIKYVARCIGLREARLTFPSPRPVLTDPKTLRDVTCRVEWTIGGFTEVLHDGRWEVETTLRGPRVQELCAAGVMTNEGGLLAIEGSGVELYFPPDALPEGEESLPLQMKIIPRGAHEDVGSSFTSHSTVMVEILPSGLELRRRVRLTLPHCLKLRPAYRGSVRIFQSHHKQGEPLALEDVTGDVEYQLRDTDCQMWLRHFSWTVYEIGEEDVLAKKLILFAACQRFRRHARYLTVDTGYYPDMAGADSVFRARAPNWYIGSIQEFLFQKLPRSPLQISLMEINPSNWTPTGSSQSPKSISYMKIASSTEQTVSFILDRGEQDPPLPVCEFAVVAQEEMSELTIQTENGALAEEEMLRSGMSSLAVQGSQSEPGALGGSGTHGGGTRASPAPVSPGDPAPRIQHGTSTERHPHDQHGGTGMLTSGSSEGRAAGSQDAHRGQADADPRRRHGTSSVRYVPTQQEGTGMSNIGSPGGGAFASPYARSPADDDTWGRVMGYPPYPPDLQREAGTPDMGSHGGGGFTSLDAHSLVEAEPGRQQLTRAMMCPPHLLGSTGTSETAMHGGGASASPDDQSRADIDPGSQIVASAAGRSPNQQGAMLALSRVNYWGGGQHLGMMQNWLNPLTFAGFGNCIQAGVYGPPLGLSGPTPRLFQELSYNQILQLGERLNVSHPLGKDWKFFASRLGFTVTDIDSLAQSTNPTGAVITAAAQRSSLESREQLIDILREMGRDDCVLCLSDSPQ